MRVNVDDHIGRGRRHVLDLSDDVDGLLGVLVVLVTVWSFACQQRYCGTQGS